MFTLARYKKPRCSEDAQARSSRATKVVGVGLAREIEMQPRWSAREPKVRRQHMVAAKRHCAITPTDMTGVDKTSSLMDVLDPCQAPRRSAGVYPGFPSARSRAAATPSGNSSRASASSAAPSKLTRSDLPIYPESKVGRSLPCTTSLGDESDSKSTRQAVSVPHRYTRITARLWSSSPAISHPYAGMVDSSDRRLRCLADGAQ